MLPHQLTEGVTATPEGLYFSGLSDAKLVLHPAILIDDPYDGKYGDYWLSWSGVAKRLRYQEGEPWCAVDEFGKIYCGTAIWPGRLGELLLRRLAAILCDNGIDFLVLHQYIKEFGND